MSTLHRLLASSLAVLLLLLLATGPALAGASDDAKRAAKDKDWAKAAAAWNKILEKKPADREAAMGLAQAAIEGWLEEDHAIAEEALHRALEKSEDDRDVRLALGNLYIAIAKAKTDPTAMKFTYEDAKTHFAKLVEAKADDEEAAVGLARAHYWTAFYDEALAVLDAFLGDGKSQGPALFWKGHVFYQQGLDAYRQSGEVDENVRALLGKAKGAYAASGEADPKYFDTWMQLGYAAQYLGETEEAKAAYERAMDLDPESTMPLKGIDALYFHLPAEHVGALKKLAKEHPDNVAVWFFLGFRLLHGKDHDAAVDAFKTYISRSKTPGTAFTFLGQAYDAQGEVAKAKDAWTKALEANPDDETAAGGLDQQLLIIHRGAAARSPNYAISAAEAWKPLFELAPNNPWVRNNIAFLLRDAVDKHRGDPDWKRVVAECTRLYAEGARLVDEQTRGRESTIPFERRFPMAGIVNDAGLMYHYYPSIRDLQKAEDHYLRALELTEDTYGDAFGNLVKLYLEQEKWQDAYDLARDCMDIAKDPNGQDSPQYRMMARQVMDKLVAEGKAKD